MSINYSISTKGDLAITGTEGEWLHLLQYALLWTQVRLSWLRSGEFSKVNSVAWNGSDLEVGTDGGPLVLNVSMPVDGLRLVKYDGVSLVLEDVPLDGALANDSMYLGVAVNFTPYGGVEHRAVIDATVPSVATFAQITAQIAILNAAIIADLNARDAIFTAAIATNSGDIAALTAQMVTLNSEFTTAATNLQNLADELTSNNEAIQLILGNVSVINDLQTAPADILDLQNRMLAAEAAILLTNTHSSRIVVLEVAAPVQDLRLDDLEAKDIVHTADIGTNLSAIGDNASAITLNDGELLDHENRLVVLEP